MKVKGLFCDKIARFFLLITIFLQRTETKEKKVHFADLIL